MFWLLDGQTGHHCWKSSLLHLLGKGWFQSGTGKRISVPAGIHMEVIILALLDEGVLQRPEGGWERGLSVKSTGCSSEDLGFIPRSHMAAHNYL